MATFDVLFVGLFCFRKTAHSAVMPDATHPADPTIPPLIPFLVVDPRDIDDSSGWEGNDPKLTAEGIYTFDKCTIDITKATEDGTLDATQHYTNVAKLHDIDKTFAYDDGSTDIITTINLGQGTLELLRRPDQDNANVSRLRVAYGGDIFVTVAVEGEANPRVLQLKPRSAVAIANLPLGPLDPSFTGNPSKEFGAIAVSRTFDSPSPIHVPGMPAIGGNYQVFKVGLSIIASGPGGCCPPP
jgi:hypothetical protein